MTNPSAAELIKIGDTVTIAGLVKSVPNPSRKWWQVWKPRMVQTGELMRYTVKGRAVEKFGYDE